MRIGSVIAVAAAAWAGANPARAQETQPFAGASTRQGPLEVVEAQFSAFNAHDVDALAAGVAEDFVWLAVEGDSVRATYGHSFPVDLGRGLSWLLPYSDTHPPGIIPPNY